MRGTMQVIVVVVILFIYSENQSSKIMNSREAAFNGFQHKFTTGNSSKWKQKLE
jgi:hypothetical protein